MRTSQDAPKTQATKDIGITKKCVPRHLESVILFPFPLWIESSHLMILQEVGGFCRTKFWNRRSPRRWENDMDFSRLLWRSENQPSQRGEANVRFHAALLNCRTRFTKGAERETQHFRPLSSLKASPLVMKILRDLWSQCS